MRRTDRVDERLESLPRGPGVYLFHGKGGRVLYVGKAADLRSRVRSYWSGEGPEDRPRIRSLLPDVRDVSVLRTATEQESLLLENSLIKKHRPPGNARLRDDKNYLCIRIDRTHEFPRLTFVRKFKRDGATYFGPYSSSRAVREAVNVLQATYGLRVCTDHVLANRKRPCIYHQMGRCSAPCDGRIDREEYAGDVARALDVLKGRTSHVVREMTRRMERHSKAMEYEKAAEVRDRIAAVRRTAEQQAVNLPDLKARDAIHVSRRKEDLLFVVLFVRDGKLISTRHHFVRSDAEYPEALCAFLVQFYAEGKAVPPEILVSEEPESRELLEGWLTEQRGGKVEIRRPLRGKARELMRLAAENSDAAMRRAEASGRDRTAFALEALAERLDLERPPSRIECFDISTIGGTATVASMVAFEDGLPEKSSYRRYKVQSIEGQDDFASMREVLSRRFKRAEEMPLPDLVVLDGGKGQLGTTLEALREMGLVDIDLVGLAKARSGREGDQANERVYLPGRKEPVVLEPDEPETLLLARIRDEAHRFAIRYHRKVRSQLAVSSQLDRIAGVGDVWRARLLRRFGSVKGVREASLEDLMLVPGLPRATAKRIHDHLRVEGDAPSG